MVIDIKGPINIHNANVASKSEFNLERDISKFDVGN